MYKVSNSLFHLSWLDEQFFRGGPKIMNHGSCNITFTSRMEKYENKKQIRKSHFLVCSHLKQCLKIFYNAYVYHLSTDI